MDRKDARRWARAPRWKTLSFLFSALAMLAVCVAVRYVWGIRSATAQTAPKFAPEKAAAGAKQISPSGAKQSAKSGAVRPAGAEGVIPTSEEDQKLAIMAIVNGEQITRQDLARECLARYGKDVLETLINKHMIMAACKKHDVTVTEKDVAEEINHMASKFGLSADRWLKLLEEQRNVNPQQYAKDIIWPTLALRQLAAEQIKVTPEELKKGMDSEFGPRVHVRIIAVNNSRDADDLRAKALADPDSFGDLAKERSVDRMSASSRGLIPPIRKHLGEPAIEKAAFALQPGGISQVIPLANQYVILKCEKHEPAVVINPEHQQDAEKRITDQLAEKKLRGAAEDLFKRLQAEAKVENIYNNERRRKEMPGVAATINGSQITIQRLSEECVTRHGHSVIDGEINRLILKQELAKKSLSVTKADLDEEVTRAARLNGFEKEGRVDVEGWLQKVTEEEGATIELYMKDAVWPTVALKNLVGDAVKVTKDDLDKAYQANYGERVEVLAIVLASHRQAQTVWDMARNDPTDAFFSKLASQYSIEPASKANGGRVPPIQRFGGQPKLEEEAFKLKRGEMSSIVAIGDKFIMLRCLGRTKPIKVERAKVEGELREDLAEKKLRMEMGKKFDELKESAQVTNFVAGTDHSPKQAKTATGPKAGPAALPSGVAPARFEQPGAPRSGSAVRPGK